MIPCSIEQAQDVVNGKTVTFVVLKKEGERLVDAYTGDFNKGSLSIPATIYKDNRFIVMAVGSPVQLVSESGEEYWYCPECKEIDTLENRVKNYGRLRPHIYSNENGDVEKGVYMCPKHSKHIDLELLVVVPKKIEDAGKNWKVS